MVPLLEIIVSHNARKKSAKYFHMNDLLLQHSEFSKLTIETLEQGVKFVRS